MVFLHIGIIVYKLIKALPVVKHAENLSPLGRGG